MKAVLVLVLLLSGCGVVHQSLHPFEEHCLYNCYDRVLRGRNMGPVADADICLARDAVLSLKLGSCRSACAQ